MCYLYGINMQNNSFIQPWGTAQDIKIAVPLQAERTHDDSRALGTLLQIEAYG